MFLFVDDTSLEARIRSHEALVHVKTLSREKIETGRSEYWKTKVEVIKFWKGDADLKEYFVMIEIGESGSCGNPAPTLEYEFLAFVWAQDSEYLYTGGCSCYSSINIESTKKEMKKIDEYFGK
ncbi:hypothetical protein P3339_18655 [Microbulbifer sp. MLAF003]|uniref:hypothetical protein n=1 Tax=Microbulbifer sp. MLAF003 TaxID=3032582 RepID=UPI0024ACCF7F|nr:hypothetical protein [Microbulbifer sp. MLAF003]WHI50440.1 hypothetical protein P3339_18655 [Microbulbifer sp. MLAF003]